MSAGDKVSASIVRVRIRLPFFGALALFLRHELDERIPTACTDGRVVLFSPEFVKSLSAAELDAVMVHEILHAALLHIPRRGTRDPFLWNVAADIVVNGIIRGEKNLKLPPDVCLDPALERYEVEEVYKILLARPRKSSIPWIGQDLAPGTDEGGLADEERREIEAHWRQAWRQAATMAATFGSGAVPDSLRRHADAVLDPQLDWRSILWRFLVRTPVDFVEFDRRLIGSGIYLEALGGETVFVRVAVDTSGSISADDLAQFIGELREIIRLYPHIDAQLYYADANLYGPLDLNEDNLKQPVGGGGTSFVPFFTLMEQELSPGENGLLVYLTDGHGTFPAKHPQLPVLWVVKAGGLTSGKFPFGVVARLTEAN